MFETVVQVRVLFKGNTKVYFTSEVWDMLGGGWIDELIQKKETTVLSGSNKEPAGM